MYRPSLAMPACVVAAPVGSGAISVHRPVARSSTWLRRVTGMKPEPLVYPPNTYSLPPTCATCASVRYSGDRGAALHAIRPTVGVGFGVELTPVTVKLTVRAVPAVPVPLAPV